MLINVDKIEIIKDNFGTKKVLTTNDGQTYKIGEKNRCYNSVSSKGQYDITMGDFQGKPFVKSIKPINVSAQPANKEMTVKSSYYDSKEKLAFEKNKQDEIKIECYSGIAKDILIHNASVAGKEVSIDKVMEVAYELIRGHKAVLDILQGKNKETSMTQPDSANQDPTI